ncbi:MAG: helix-hairpin-helix domain-containing protein, partial [Verrucomicrobiota bacterium]|nr:helix-hairpin-helix domain-containing protein [Verrucomicrobiota bacterium]
LIDGRNHRTLRDVQTHEPVRSIAVKARRTIRVCSFAAAFIAVSPFLTAKSHPPANLPRSSSWTTLSDCQYVTNASNDGDSFHVTARGKQYLFRLYFVDTPETDSSLGDRIDEQAKYFGITPEQTIKVGKTATQFTREKLTQSFTVRTCFQDALGRSKMERFYAIVQTTSGDLGEQLIENGLARKHGASANPVGLPRANVEWQKLEGLERAAKLEKVGGWGVKYGRMLARAASAKNRVPVDPFDAFFHPERVQREQAMPSVSGSAWPFPSPTPVARSTTPKSSALANSFEVANSTQPSPQAQNGKLDINTATEKQLDGVPGIGPVLAGRIVAARPFKSADDLRNVKGIGDTRYGKIRPFFQ